MPNAFAAVFYPQTLDNLATKDADRRLTEMKVESMGGGNVSKIGRLQPETVTEMRSYYLPI